MSEKLDLIQETIDHFSEGARSVRAYTNDITYIITKVTGAEGYWVAAEEPGFPKTKVTSLEELYQEVFGVEAKY